MDEMFFFLRMLGQHFHTIVRQKIFLIWLKFDDFCFTAYGYEKD